jgi:hypothetical protein
VSRFLPDRLYLGIEPGRVTLVRVSGLWRPRIVAAEQFALPAAEPDTIGLPLLERELRTPRWQRTRVHVVLADTLVRYFIAPVPEGARNRRELQEAAMVRCEEIFGEETKAWTIMIDLAPLATHHLGCAFRTAWLDGLRRCCREAGLPLAGVTPFGVAEFNRNERQIGQRSGWFAALGTDTLWLAFKAGNGWRCAQVHRRSGDTLAELPQWLAQDQLRAGITETKKQPLWLAGDLADTPALSAPSGTLVRRCAAPTWPGTDAAWSRTFRLALSPVWPACA